jgi:hypothetical protein
MAMNKYFSTRPTLADGDQIQQPATTKGAAVVSLEDSAGNAIAAGNGLWVSPLDGTLGSGTVSSATTIISVDTLGYQSIHMQWTNAGSGCTATYEESNDNTNWIAKFVDRSDNTSSYPNTALAPSTSHVLSVTLRLRYFRVRISTYGSGSPAIAYVLRSNDNPQQTQLLRGAAAVTTDMGVIGLVGRSSGSGMLRSTIQSAATTNATSVKASAGQVYAIVAGTTTAAIAYLKLYNKASAPTVGTDTPVMTIPLPASGNTVVITFSVGDVFGTGIAYAITGGAAISDTTAVATNQVTGFIQYV